MHRESNAPIELPAPTASAGAILEPMSVSAQGVIVRQMIAKLITFHSIVIESF